MADTTWSKTNPVAAHISADGLILDVNTSDLGNADTSYTYFLLGAAGYNSFALDYVITATTLTLEGSNDDLNVEDNDNEKITATNDRTFAGAGNWAADGTGAAVVVNGGVLEVTVGNALTGAKLPATAFNSGLGFVHGRRYTVTFTIASVSAGTVTLYAGTQLVATGLTNGAAQTATFTAIRPGAKLSLVGTTAAATFTLDNMAIKAVSAVWTDITNVITDGAATTLTATGSVSQQQSLPWARMRVKRLTTNATNALELRLTRQRL